MTLLWFRRLVIFRIVSERWGQRLSCAANSNGCDDGGMGQKQGRFTVHGDADVEYQLVDHHPTTRPTTESI